MLQVVEASGVSPSSGWALADPLRRLPDLPGGIPSTGRPSGGHFGIPRSALDRAQRLG
jgi:hypothetical protein